jgi:fumarylacetoacetate (FAA) hydrolase family protein
MQPGDVVEVAIDPIGTLTNTVVAETPELRARPQAAASN